MSRRFTVIHDAHERAARAGALGVAAAADTDPSTTQTEIKSKLQADKS